MRKLFQRQKRLATSIAMLLVVLAATVSAAAQSTDVAFPTAVTANEIEGRISPRDIGDARLTRHFYIFIGTPGDLVVTVESKNLNGDVDLFAAGMRPITKITLYAGADSSTATKSVYLRRQEGLILRVEARSMNDGEGSYRIRFDGTFAPASSEMIAQSENNRLAAPVVSSTRASGRRVTSVGGKIEEIEAERIEAKNSEAKDSEAKASEATESGESASIARAPAPATDPEPSPPVEPTTTPKPVVIRSTRSRARRPRPTRVRNESPAKKSASALKTAEPLSPRQQAHQQSVRG